MVGSMAQQTRSYRCRRPRINISYTLSLTNFDKYITLIIGIVIIRIVYIDNVICIHCLTHDVTHIIGDQMMNQLPSEMAIIAFNYIR